MSIFNAFEHSFRIISKNYDTNLYEQQENSINSLFTAFLRPLQLNVDNRAQFINVVSRVRNSIHNNGVFVSPKEKNAKFVWDNHPYEFDHGKPITIPDIWLHYIKFTKEFVAIFDEISGSVEVQKNRYYVDITEQVR
jgi:hypothetical protein